MSWLISIALMKAYENSRSLPELVAEYSAGSCSDGEPSVPSSGSLIPLAYCAPDKMTDFSRLSRFGVTYKPLMEDLGEDLLTWFRAGFPAKTSALQEKAQESKESDLGCGPKWRGWLARFDRDSSSWKTVQPSLLVDSDECSVTWPRSGMTADGLCWELPTLAPPIGATGFGLWPTPISTEWKAGCGKLGNRSTEKAAKAGWKLTEAVQMWPTPVASDTSSRTKPYAQGGTPLSLAVKYQTPNTSGMDGRSNSRKATIKRGQQVLNGGQLNPPWVEWLMGWPIGWTDLKPLETDKSPNALHKHGES